jgi:hypothetical protein
MQIFCPSLNCVLSWWLIYKSSSWALVAHACNPSNSGDEEQEDEVRGQPRQIVLETYFENTQHSKKGLAEQLKW